MKKTNLYLLALSFLVVVSSCGDDGKKIENPAQYEFKRNDESSVSFSGQTARLQMAQELTSLVGGLSGTEVQALEMYANETADGGDANPFSSADLNESTKSIRSKVAASQDIFKSNTAESSQIKEKIEAFIANQYAETLPAENDLAEEGKAGQIADGTKVRYVNAKGMENNQLIAKSLIGALALDQTVSNYLSPAVLDAENNVSENDEGTVASGKNYTTMEHKWDEAYGYVFGLSTDAADPLATLGEGSFLNKYLKRVDDDSDFSGIAKDIYEAFKLGRAAIVAGDYEVRDEQAEIIKKKLSEVVGIRAVYYLQAGKSELEAGNYGSAFHDLSEGYGFVYSLRFTRNATGATTLFSETEVNNFIDTLEKNNGFWSLTSQELDTMSEAIAAKFDFTVEQAAN